MIVDGAMQSPGRVLFVLSPGTTSELRFTTGNNALSVLQAEITPRKSSDASKLSAKILDAGGARWRSFAFASSINVYIDGKNVFAGQIVTRSAQPIGGDVLLKIECVGNSNYLYARTMPYAQTYTGMTTGSIAASVIVSAGGSPTLNVGSITTATGVTPTSFDVSANENVGTIFERLTKLDGYNFGVDASNNVLYYAVSGTSQLTITEDDLEGTDEDAHPVELGVTPPRNVVRVIGGSGYATAIKQESQDSTYALDSNQKILAQSFIAQSTVLSGVDLFATYTAAPNAPGTLSFTVQADGRPTTTSLAGSTGITNITGFGGTSYIGETITMPTPPGGGTVTLTSFTLWLQGNPGPIGVTPVIFTTSGGVPPGVVPSGITGFATSGSIPGSATAFTATGSVQLNPGGTYFIGVSFTTGNGVYLQPLGPGSNSYSGGACYTNQTGAGWTAQTTDQAFSFTVTQGNLPSGTPLAWSSDVSFTTDDFPYPPSWNTSTKTYSTPKLAVTNGAKYWIVLQDSGSPSGTSNWQLGYYAASDAYTSGSLIASTDNGTTWAATGYDLTFRLWWSYSQSVDVTVTNSTSTAKWGTWPYEETDDTITSVADATTVATLISTLYADPGIRITLPLVDAHPELSLSQMVTVKRPLLDIDGAYQIAEISHVIDGNNGDKVRTILTVGTPEYNIARALEDLRKKVN